VTFIEFLSGHDRFYVSGLVAIYTLSYFNIPRCVFLVCNELSFKTFLAATAKRNYPDIQQRKRTV